MGFVSVDGGGGYWNHHPGDDPMQMLVKEVIPMCQAKGLGTPPAKIGAYGVSMGGYGSLLLAERHPRLISAVSAISPAIWTTYSEAHSANPGAYASADDFAYDDVVTHANLLKGTPVRIACGVSDPFYPGVQALAAVLPAGDIAFFGKGCHSGDFFRSQQPAAFEFLSRQLA